MALDLDRYSSSLRLPISFEGCQLVLRYLIDIGEVVLQKLEQ